MNTPNFTGDQALDDIAQRHGFSSDAARSMLDSVRAGRGSMAQFSHPEFGGSGQWMRGGMTMVSDFSDNTLRGRVDALCQDLAQLVDSQPDVATQGSFQSQSSNAGSGKGGGKGSGIERGPFLSSQSDHWWPGTLGSPDSTGAQNGARYAWFSQAARLAIEVDGRVTVYDTQDHRIGGFSQAQSTGSTMGFHSQHGDIDVEKLPVVSRGDGENRVPHPADPESATPAFVARPSMSSPASSSSSTATPGRGPAPASSRAAIASGPADPDVFSLIEKLAALHAKGVLSDDEFKDKKAELLGRI
ncbi:MAG: hypothetical protein JWQ11_2864 [Rhizobacter sp.]|nr:hypothetical protein [Rhizobacter sp.]